MTIRASAALAAFLLTIPALTSAQTVEFGIKGGLSFANIPQLAEFFEDQGAPEVGFRTGVTFGGHVALPIGDTMAIQPEVFYTQRGLQGEAPFDLGDFAAHLDYIDIPVLLRIGAGDSGFTLLAGPSFNFLVGATGTADDEEDEDIKDSFETFDLGLVFGAGYYGNALIIEGRFQEGLTNIARGDLELADDARNRSFMVLVGVRFR